MSKIKLIKSTKWKKVKKKTLFEFLSWIFRANPPLNDYSWKILKLRLILQMANNRCVFTYTDPGKIKNIPIIADQMYFKAH